MKIRKVAIFNKENQKIVGLLSLPEKENTPIVIIIHGFKGTKEYYPFVNNSVKPLTDAGIAVLRIDCRGSGESDLEFKNMTITSESEDVLTSINYVKTLDTDSKRIGLIGISMGAAAILMAIKQNPEIKTLVFWSPAWYFNGEHYYDTPHHRKTIKEEGVFYVTQRFTGKRLIAGKEHFEEKIVLNTRPFTKFVKVPVLILRGSEDKIGLYTDKEATELLNAEFRIIKNGDHNFTNKNSERELIKQTIEWFNRYL